MRVNGDSRGDEEATSYSAGSVGGVHVLRRPFIW